MRDEFLLFINHKVCGIFYYNSAEWTKTTREHYKQFYVNKFNNETDQFHKRHKLSKYMRKEIDNLNDLLLKILRL